MARFNTHHVRVLIISEIRQLLCTLHPRVPQHRVREIVFLDAHLPAGHHIRDDVFLWSVLVYAVGPLIDCDDIPPLLADGIYASLVYIRAAVQARYLAAPHVRHLEVRVQQHVETERHLLARIVNGYVEVQLLLPQNQTVRQTESAQQTTQQHTVNSTQAQRNQTFILTSNSTWSG